MALFWNEPRPKQSKEQEEALSGFAQITIGAETSHLR